MSDKCPFCGNDEQESLSAGVIRFGCGTRQDIKYGWKIRGTECYETQIAKLQAELASAREFIEEVVQIGRLMKNA